MKRKFAPRRKRWPRRLFVARLLARSIACALSLFFCRPLDAHYRVPMRVLACTLDCDTRHCRHRLLCIFKWTLNRGRRLFPHCRQPIDARVRIVCTTARSASREHELHH